MKLKSLALSAAVAAVMAAPAHAQVEIQWWHSMGGALGEWVNDLAKDFNSSQTASASSPPSRAATTSR
jgi:sn-glycerol 3-phosphate transport system substrate-binding protein